MSKKELKDYVVTETITIEYRIPAWSESDAQEKYESMMEDSDNRVQVTTEGSTSSSSTTTDIIVETSEEFDARTYE
jgi:hypothetical protein